MLHDAEHEPTPYLRQRVKDLAMAGIPQKTIARIVGMSSNTLAKYYDRELHDSEPDMIGKVAKVAVQKALDGNEKMLSYVLSRKGSKYGWIDKQVIESVTDSENLDKLKDKIDKLEKKHEKDY